MTKTMPKTTEQMTQKRVAQLIEKLSSDNGFYSKQELCYHLGLEYNTTNDRRIRHYISIIAKEHPIIALSGVGKYKLATAADRAYLEHQHNENHRRAVQIIQRNLPILNLLEKINENQ